MSRLTLWSAVSFVVGMSFSFWTQTFWLSVLLLVAAVSGAIFDFVLRRRSLPFSRLTVICLLLVVCALGMFVYEWSDARNVSKLTSVGAEQTNTQPEPIRIMGFIASPVEIDGDRATLRVDTRLVGKTEVAEQLHVSIRLLTEQEQRAAKAWERGQYISIAGQLLRPDEARNANAFDYRNYLRQQHVHMQLRVKGLAEAQVVESSWNTYHVMRYIDRSRTFLAAQLDEQYNEPHAGFMKGILLGLRDAMDPEQYRQFSLLGLTHIIAISGLNVGIFVFVCFGLLRLLRRTKETNILIVMSLIPIYILLTGASPSVVRAGIMAIIALWAARQNRLKDGLNIISIVAVLMLLWNPYYLVDIGFQLSFLVTLGLLVGVPLMNRLLPVRKVWLKNAISVTTVAQLVAFPLTVYYFNQFSLLSWFANLALVPYVSLLIYPLGLVSLVSGLLSDLVGQWLALLVTWLDRGLFAVIEYFSGFHTMQLIIGTPPFWWLIAYYVACAAILMFLLRRHEVLHPPVLPEVAEAFGPYIPALNRALAPRYLLAALTSGLALFVMLLLLYWPPSSDVGTVSFIDVGQGDAILIRTPDGHHALIDGGGTIQFGEKEQWAIRRDPFEIGEKVLVPLLKKRGVQEIDLLVVSHQDADHIGGLAAVIESIPVKRILFNGTLKPKPLAQQLFQAALARGVQLYEVRAGEQLRLDEQTVLDILSPAGDSDPERLALAQDQNEYSVAFVMTMYDRRFLFTGDMGTSSERAILDDATAAGRALRAVDVLKVAHHGSKSSTSSEWLDTWRPQIAVISVGRNNMYRHPHPTVMARLQESGTDIFRTDLHGEVRITVGPQAFDVEQIVQP